jgi:hypothetical protein
MTKNKLLKALFLDDDILIIHDDVDKLQILVFRLNKVCKTKNFIISTKNKS